MWRNDVGIMLSEMMEMAGYTLQLQKYHFDFFARNVAPVLGAHPEVKRSSRLWKSFMNDDHSPAEFSWSWSVAATTPTVRYSFEPIGQRAGQFPDYFNIHPSAELVHRIQRSHHGVDLTWYTHFFERFIVHGKNSLVKELVENNDSSSQIFLAFDLLGKDIMLKVYFLPTLKAMETRHSKLSIVENAINTLPTHGQSLGNAFSLVSDYIRSLRVIHRPEVEIIAIDCAVTSVSRVKVYLRTRQTSFDSVVDMLTLGGRLRHFSTEGLASLENLWRLVLSLDQSISTSQPLHQNDHRTAGVLYYFELRPGRSYPEPKVYIPVKHYGKNDFEVANGLSTYLKAKGKGLVGDDYRDGVQRLWYVETQSALSPLL